MTFALIKWLNSYISSVKKTKFMFYILNADWLVVNTRVIECFSLAVTNEIALFATDYRRYIINTLISPSIVRKARPQNKDTVLASARLRVIPFWTSAILNIKEWIPLKRALARTMAQAFWWWITVTPKSLENHRKNQEVGLLCSLFCGQAQG